MVKWLLQQILNCDKVFENESLSVTDRENALIQQKTYKRVLDHYRQSRKHSKQDQNHAHRNATLFD